MRNILAIICTAAVLGAGCGTDSGGDLTSSAPVDVAGDKDTSGDDSGVSPSDTAVEQDAGTTADATTSDTESGDVAAQDAADTSADTAETTIDCPGGAGCDCLDNSDCDAGYCIQDGATKKCASKCVDSCSDGYQCVPVGAGDVTLICAPLYNNICNPCAKSDDCKALGQADAVCLDYGNLGAFCGIPCSDDKGCPTGYGCKTGKSVEGATSKQCLKNPDDASGKPGLCACSDVASTKKLSTSCLVENKNDKGEIVGLCPGSRTCGESGLSECAGPPADIEKCDGVDNDCDGSTDESGCDDNNSCTTDACSASGGGTPACVHSNLDTACDADGSVCTEKDTCKNGVCTPGGAKPCDDGNPCTLDKCDAAKGCTATDDDGTACDDDNKCTQGDTCKAGSCAAGKAAECGTNDPCVAGKCDLTSGKCAYKNLTAACDDANACTAKDTCDGGFCTGAPVDCNDKNPCTSDVCKAGVGCQNTANTAPCDDGNVCTDADGCAKGLCVGLAKNLTADCDDNNPCTTPGCDAKTGCTQTANKLTCDDGNPCTVGDVCGDKACAAGTNTCQCDADKDCADKEDGDLCNGTLFCDKTKAPFTCAVIPTTIVTCTGKPTSCQQDRCDAKTGKCGLVAIGEGKTCDADDSVCTKGDACENGVCAAGDAVKCDDGNPCTDDACDAKAGCVNTQNSASCNADDNACTVADVCSKGVCLAGAKKSCDDGNSCTADLCDAVTGTCAYAKDALDGVGCNADGSVCTKDDKCGDGVCKAGPVLPCDDNNACTDDSCDKASGCVHKVSTKTCEDGDPCTDGDLCADAKCVAGKNVCECQKTADCASNEDGDRCNGTLICNISKAPFRCEVDTKTIIVCDASKDGTCRKNTCQQKDGSCVVEAVNTGKSCDDGNACTNGDACIAEAGGIDGCKPGSAVVCDDKNVCTVDSCDIKTGCATVVDLKATFDCYDGPEKTEGVGLCKKGSHQCNEDGTLEDCANDVVPTKTEACDGFDNTCDGQTDTGCTPVDFATSEAAVLFDDSDTKMRLRARVGGGVQGPTNGTGKVEATFGFWSWLRARVP